MPNTNELTNSANAISGWRASGATCLPASAATSIAEQTTDRMPMPEIGLFDDPISPAM